jgi:hypothetical protein
MSKKREMLTSKSKQTQFLLHNKCILKAFSRKMKLNEWGLFCPNNRGANEYKFVTLPSQKRGKIHPINYKSNGFFISFTNTL